MGFKQNKVFMKLSQYMTSKGTKAETRTPESFPASRDKFKPREQWLRMLEWEVDDTLASGDFSWILQHTLSRYIYFLVCPGEALTVYRWSNFV